jgi:hypothetical protein
MGSSGLAQLTLFPPVSGSPSNFYDKGKIQTTWDKNRPPPANEMGRSVFGTKRNFLLFHPYQ